MNTIFEVRVPAFPTCWTTCGNCGSGAVLVDDIRVLPGDTIERDDPVIVLETGKTALDIPCPRSGVVVELFVGPGDEVVSGQLILTLDVVDPDDQTATR